MPTDDFAIAIAPLKELGGQRVWSLMISLFGDLARDDGQVIDGPILSAIMAAMDVRPEAARVALHRLRKDNWIASEKHGRISKHSLTPEGRAQSQAASSRIYATPADLHQGWQLILLETVPDQVPAGFVAVEGRVLAGVADAIAPADALALPSDSAPEWLKMQLEPHALAGPYGLLFDALSHAAAALPPKDSLTPLQIATLRCLIVHNWRRLALKHAALPLSLVRADWAGHKSHILVAELLRRYPRPVLSGITPS